MPEKIIALSSIGSLLRVRTQNIKKLGVYKATNVDQIS